MGLYPDSEEVEAETKIIKAQIIVGIFGSFSEDKKPILENLKSYLRENGYTKVYTADDFPSPVPPINVGDAKYKDSYERAMELTQQCNIAIVFIWDETHDSGINESAITELTALIIKGHENVIVLEETGHTFRTNVKGIKYSKCLIWDWKNDLQMEKISDVYLYIKTKMPRYNSLQVSRGY